MRLNNEQRERVEENIRLAYKRSHYWHARLKDCFEYEDILSFCQEGLINASRAFRDDKRVTFSTFAYSCMDQNVMQKLRDSKALKRQPVVPHLYIDGIKDEKGREVGQNFLTTEFLSGIEFEEEINKLRESDYATLKLHIDGYTQHEISALTGVSQVQVSRRLKRIKKELKGRLVS